LVKVLTVNDDNLQLEVKRIRSELRCPNGIAVCRTLGSNPSLGGSYCTDCR